MFSAGCSNWSRSLLKQARSVSNIKLPPPPPSSSPLLVEKDTSSSSSSSSSSEVVAVPPVAKPPEAKKVTPISASVTGFVIRTTTVDNRGAVRFVRASSSSSSSSGGPDNKSTIRLLPANQESLAALCSSGGNGDAAASVFAAKHEWVGYELTVSGRAKAQSILKLLAAAAASGGNSQVVILGNRSIVGRLVSVTPSDSLDRATVTFRKEQSSGYGGYDEETPFDPETTCVCVVDSANRPRRVCSLLHTAIFASDSSSSSSSAAVSSQSKLAWQRRWEKRSLRAQSPLAAVFDWYKKRDRQAVAFFDSFEFAAAKKSEYEYAMEVVWAMCLYGWLRTAEVVAALILDVPMPATVLQAVANFFQRDIRLIVQPQKCEDGRVFVGVTAKDKTGKISNPKQVYKDGTPSATYRRFQQYFGQEGKRVCDILEYTDITMADVNWDSNPKRDLIQLKPAASAGGAAAPVIPGFVVEYKAAALHPTAPTKATAAPTIELVWNRKTNVYSPAS